MGKYVLGAVSLAILFGCAKAWGWGGVAGAIVVLGFLWWDAIPAVARKCILGAIALGFIAICASMFGWWGVLASVALVLCWYGMCLFVSAVAAAITHAIFNDEAEERRPQEYRVKRNHKIVLPANCPECGLLITHVVCPRCRNTYYELGNCPHCRQRVKALSCPSCGTVFHL